MGRFSPLHRFGWAFLLAWVFCIFYTQVVKGYVGAATGLSAERGPLVHVFFLGLPVFFSILMLLLIVQQERQLGSPVVHRVFFWVAPLATAISTPLLFVNTASFAATVICFVGGSILTGIGSGFLWVMWGEFYTKVSQEDVEFLAPVSAVIAAVLVLLVSAMDGWIALVVVIAFPLLSGLCLAKAWHGVQANIATAEHSGEAEQMAYSDAHNALVQHPLVALRSMGRSGFGILVACLFVCLLGSLWQVTVKDSLLFQAVIIASIVFVAVVALLSGIGPRRISVSFLFRWMCPVLVIGFSCIVLFGEVVGSYIAYLLSIGARFSFCLITQMYFAHFATTGRTTAVQAYGLGWILVHLGDFLGVLMSVMFASATGIWVLAPANIAAISSMALVVLTMFVLNDSKSFSFDTKVAKRTNSLGEAEVKPAVQDNDIATKLQNDWEQRVLSLAKIHSLTPREIEVFDLLARGRSVPFIRDALVISRDTAATHVKHVYTKLAVHSRQELIDLLQ